MGPLKIEDQVESNLAYCKKNEVSFRDVYVFMWVLANMHANSNINVDRNVCVYIKPSCQHKYICIYIYVYIYLHVYANIFYNI